MKQSVVLAWILVIGLGLLAAGVLAEPSLDQVRALVGGGPLGAEATGKVAEYVEHWIDKLMAAATPQELTEARQGLIKGYQGHPSRYYQLAYAKAAAAKAPAALSGNFRPMPQAKHISLAMAVATMEQITIQPALEEMAKHDNPAVRYWAAKGYRSIGSLLLIQGGQHAEKMLATLERLGLSETSGPVVGGVLHAVSGYGEMDSKHAQKLKDVLDKVWLARCKDVYEAQGEMVEAYRKAVNFLRTASKSEQKLVMQLLADALEAASLAYKDKQKREGPVGQVYVELMIRIENRLANLTRTNRRPVEAALDNDKDPVGTRAVKARLAVNNHWKSLLSKDWGVSMRFTPPPPTSKPATTPARAVMASTAPAATD